MEVLLDIDGTLRDTSTLEKLGHWFRVGEVIYRMLDIEDNIININNK